MSQAQKTSFSSPHRGSPDWKRGYFFFRHRPHHWFPRWHQRWSYKYPPHVLIEECVCFNRNAKALNTQMSLHKGSIHNFSWAYSTVNIVSPIESRDTQTHAGDHLLHIISNEKNTTGWKQTPIHSQLTQPPSLLHTGKAKSQRDHCGRFTRL